MTSLNLLGVERGRIAHIPLNVVTRIQAKAMRQELRKHDKEKLKQASTSDGQSPKLDTS